MKNKRFWFFTGCIAVFFLVIALFNIRKSDNVVVVSQQNAEGTEVGATVTEKNTKQSETALLEEEVLRILSKMTLEEKVAQMFIITPEALPGGGEVDSAGNMTKEAMEQYPVGGFVYFGQNIKTKEQVISMIQLQQEYSMQRTGLPLFISIDEEGGKVARIGNESSIQVEDFRNLSDIGADADIDEVRRLGSGIGSYLVELGFNLNFAPVADVLTNPENTVVKERSFGSDPKTVSQMVLEEMDQMQNQGIDACIKHFPGHGATTGDSHNGFAFTTKTFDEMKKEELLPFIDAIKKDVSFIMVGHISAPKITGDDRPSSLSKVMVTDILRNKLEYNKIIITDAMNMGAISEQYGSGEAAVDAVDAGVDIILMPSDFPEAYTEVLSAVRDGDISEERVNESVKRIIRKKIK